MKTDKQVRPEKLSFQDFMAAFRAQYEYGMPKLQKDFSFTEQMIHKHNRDLHGIIVRQAGKSIAPVFYYEDLYSSYCNGTSLEQCIKEVVKFVTGKTMPDDNFREQLISWDYICEKLILKLINQKRNSSLLSESPYMSFGDMALVVQIYLDDESLGKGAITVDQDLIRMWNISKNTVFSRAMENMKKYAITAIDLLDYAGDGKKIDPETPKIYVYSYDAPFPGAAAIIRNDKLHEFAESKEMDFYLLPVSMHEALLIEYKKDISKEFLFGMLNSINTDKGLSDSMISDEVYLLRRNQDNLMNISDGKEIVLFE